MAVLAHYMRFVPFHLGFRNFFESLESCIHGGINIGYFRFKVSFIMDQSCAVQFSDFFCRTAEIASEAGFISHGPHNDTWMVPVSFHHTDTPVHVSFSPGWIVGNPFVISCPLKSVAFQIRLIDDIQSVLVAQVIKIFVSRIVGAAHSIDIMLFH